MWRFTLKVAVSATLIAWLLGRTPVADVGAILSTMNAATLLGAAALTLLTWLVSAVRLWVLAPELSLPGVVRMTFVAIYYGTVLPGQIAGDVMKAYRLSRYQLTPGRSAAATLVDRVVATLALFLLGTFAVLWVEEAPAGAAPIFALVTVVMLVGMVVLAKPWTHAALSRLLGSSNEGLRGLPGRIVEAMHQVLRHPARLGACFAIALLFHALCVAIHIVLATALGIMLPIAAWIFVYAGVSLLLLLPISVAGLGLREGGYVGMLGVMGVSSPQALALSFLIFSLLLFGALLGWLAEIAGAPPSPR